jgi:hypothetical protein
MASITFVSLHALTVYSSMLEGMEECDRDNGEPDDIASADRMVRIGELLDSIPDDSAFPFTLEIPEGLAQTAEDIAENCYDNSSGFSQESRDENMAEHGDESDESGYIFAGEVTISRDGVA